MPGGRSPLRILIVEDEALLAMDLELTMEEFGHEVIGEATCLDTAQALPDTIDPDVALVDVHLARGASGLDVSAMIHRRWPDALVVFVTANPQQIPSDLDQPYGVIAKPFSHNGLRAAISYLEEGLRTPPPRSQRPDSFAASQALATSWSA